MIEHCRIAMYSLYSLQNCESNTGRMIRSSAFWVVSHVQTKILWVWRVLQWLRPGSYMKSVPSGTVGTPSGSGATARSDYPGKWPHVALEAPSSDGGETARSSEPVRLLWLNGNHWTDESLFHFVAFGGSFTTRNLSATIQIAWWINRICNSCRSRGMGRP